MRNLTADRWRIAAAILATAHMIIAFLYPLGLAVSRLPFHSDSAINSPAIPWVHVAAALALLIAIRNPRWRDMASVATCAVWFGYASLLMFSAWLSSPHQSLAAPVMALALAAVGAGLVLRWGKDDGATW